MAPDVHAISVVTNGARKTTYLVAGFKENRLDTSTPLKLDGGGEAGRPGTDDDGDFLGHEISGEAPALNVGSESHIIALSSNPLPVNRDMEILTGCLGLSEV